MQASIFEISIFPLVLQIPVSRRIHIGGVRARIRAEYRKRFVGGGCEGGGRGRKRRNVRASRHRRTLRLHPIPRFYSLIPLCSPPGSQGDFYSSLRISTLTSRHPQPSPFPFAPTSLPPAFVLSFSLSALAQATLWFLSRSSQQHPLPGPFRPSSVPSPSSPSPRQPREHIASFVYPVL